MYEVITYHQQDKWNERLNELSKQDIFYSLSYADLYRPMGDGEPHLFFFEDRNGNKLCYSFLKRKINGLPFVSNESGQDELFDLITPSYGYGGPIYDPDKLPCLEQFRQEFETYCQSENIICEFIRFHPLLKNERFLEPFVEISNDRETIFIDLTKTEAEIMGQYHSNHKRNVKKAMNHHLHFKVFTKEEALGQVQEFYQLYCETMDKLQASTYSYFSEVYIEKILSYFPGNSMIGAVFIEDRMIAAALCIHEGGVLHYHLGCSKKDFLKLGSSIFLLHSIALWGKQQGLTVFHLGGGHVGRDSLFQYKYRFNPNGMLDFHIGKKIHIQEKYQWLLNRWEEYYGTAVPKSFFPAYRGRQKQVD